MSNYTQGFANFDCITTLNGAINDSVTSITLTDITPSSLSYTRIRIDDEFMFVVSWIGADITVIRGIEGTTAAAHSNGATVYPVVTAEGLVKRIEEGNLEIAYYSGTALTLDDTYFTLYMINTSDCTITLPTGGSTGRSYVIKKSIDNNALVTIVPSGADTIEEESSYVLSRHSDVVMLQYNASNNEWNIKNSYLKSDHRLNFTSQSGSTYTAVNGDYVLCDLSSNSMTVNLPASPVVGNLIGVKLVSGYVNRTVTIDPDGAAQIDGHSILILYIENDFVEIMWDGAEWQVVTDGVQAHVAKMYRSAAQSIANATDDLVEFDSIAFDNASIATTGASAQFTIKRAGLYQVTANSLSAAVIDDGEIWGNLIFVNGTRICQNISYSPGTNFRVGGPATEIISLNEYDVVTMYIYNGEGSAQNTDTEVYRRPTMTVSEVRGVGYSSGSRIAAFNFTQQATPTYSAVNGDYVLCDLTSNSMTINLPQSPSVNDRIGVKLSVASGTNTVTVDPYGSQEIDGATTVVLYILNDFIEIMWDGTSWRVISDGIKPHIARMRATSAQAITSSAATFAFDTSDFDNAGLISLASDSITIRRGGFYDTSAYFRISTVLDASERIILNLYINGVSENESIWYSPGTDLTVAAQHHWKGTLNAGDVLTWSALQSDNAGNQNSAASATIYPYAAVVEQRGGGFGSGGAIPLSEVMVYDPGAGAAGQGTTNTKIRRYVTTYINTGTAITYSDSSTLGAKFLINESGIYFIQRRDSTSVVPNACGCSVNSSQLTTEIFSITAANRLPMNCTCTGSGVIGSDCIVVRLSAGDEVRPHDSTNVMTGTNANRYFRIMKIGN